MQQEQSPRRTVRKIIVRAVVPLLVIVGGTFVAQQVAHAATAYYVSSSTGNDANNGTSSATPWRTLAKASTITYAPGDSLLLRSGDTWNEELAPKGNGTAASPILISSYGTGARPHINRGNETNTSLVGLRLLNVAGYKITNIEISNSFRGIFADYANGVTGKDYLWIENVYLHDMNYNPGTPWGEGVAIHSAQSTGAQVLSNVTIRDSVFERITAAVWIGTVPEKTFHTTFVNFDLINLTATGGKSLQYAIHNVTDLFHDNVKIKEIGYGYFNPTGIAGAGLLNNNNVVIQNSDFGDVSRGLNSNDGEAYDFEGDTHNVTVNNTYFHDSEGPAIMLYDHGNGQENRNVHINNSVFNAKVYNPAPGFCDCSMAFLGPDHHGSVRNTKFYLSPMEVMSGWTHPTDFDWTGNSSWRWSKVDDRDSTMTYTGTWSNWPDAGNYQGTEKNSNVTNSAAELRFYGSAVEWIGDRYSTYGRADVYLDGTLVKSNVDLYYPSKVFNQTLYSNLNLALGWHTLRVVVNGTKNPASAGFNVNIDAFAFATTSNRHYDSAEGAPLTYNGTWSTFDDFATFGSSERNSNITGNYAELTFTGTGVEWIGAKYYLYGMANVYIDGVLAASNIDLYNVNPTKLYQQRLFKVAGLPYGSHTIRVQVSGNKNPASSGFYVNVDAFHVNTGSANEIDDRSTAITYSGSWPNYDDPFQYSSSERNSNTTGNYAQYTFTGTQIAWIGAKNNTYGKANVYIDNVLVASGVDLYASSKLHQQMLFRATGLTNASHTIKVEVAGTKNASSSGFYVNMDAFFKG